MVPDYSQDMVTEVVDPADSRMVAVARVAHILVGCNVSVRFP